MLVSSVIGISRDMIYHVCSSLIPSYPGASPTCGSTNSQHCKEAVADRTSSLVRQIRVLEERMNIVESAQDTRNCTGSLGTLVRQNAGGASTPGNEGGGLGVDVAQRTDDRMQTELAFLRNEISVLRAEVEWNHGLMCAREDLPSYSS